LYSELNRRKAIVYIHPTVPANGKFPKMKIPTSVEEFVFDTTRAISSLILNKTLKRFPKIRFIVSHAGGTAPYIAWRMSLLDYRVHTDTINDLKRLYYDTALSASPYALRSLQELVNPSHILFGSDYPFAPEIITRMTISGLNTFNGFDEKQLRGINRENAIDLFPQFVRK
jgi:6-methylsalicylate decarboxylase